MFSVKISTGIRPGFAVDIDNVLAEAEPEVQRIFHELTGRSWPSNMYASAGGLDGSRLDKSLVTRIFDYFHHQSIPLLPVQPGGKAALEWCKQQYRIVIITARHPDSRPQTQEWLERHEIPFDELHFSADKTDVAENISLAVDDHPEHVLGYCNQGIPVFLMDQPWNQECSAPLVTRVTSWESLLNFMRQQPLDQQVPLST